MAKQKLGAGKHVISSNPEKGTQMIVVITIGKNGKKKSRTIHTKNGQSVFD